MVIVQLWVVVTAVDAPFYVRFGYTLVDGRFLFGHGFVVFCGAIHSQILQADARAEKGRGAGHTIAGQLLIGVIGQVQYACLQG